jgi:hypothetical protein
MQPPAALAISLGARLKKLTCYAASTSPIIAFGRQSQANTIMASAPERPRKARRAKARIGKKAVVGYFSQDMSDTLHAIADSEGVTIQSLLGESLDMLLEQRGQHKRGER